MADSREAINLNRDIRDLKSQIINAAGNCWPPRPNPVRIISHKSVLPVVSEMVLSSESLVANVTSIGPLICVGPLVD